MTFDRPDFLWFLPAVVHLVAWLIHDRQRRARDWRALAQRGRAPGLRSVSMITAAVLLTMAVARPRFGPIVGPPLPPGHDVVLLIDTSRSMGAEDAAPNRLSVAIESAESLVTALSPEDANRAGIVAFAGRGVLRCPLTENLGAVMDELRKLRVGTVQPGGTDLGAGLDAAIEAFGQQEHAEGRSVVLFSDGEDLAEHWRSRIDRLVSAGVIVHVVAIGDAEQGHPVPSDRPGQPLAFEGQQVLSRRQDGTLEAIASATEGAILRLGLAPIDLGTLYRTRIAPVARIRREATRRPERTEQFPAFLAMALLFCLAGIRPAGRPGPLAWAWARATASLLFLGVGLATAFTGAGPNDGTATTAAPTGGLTRSGVAEHVARGQSAYVAGRFADALGEYAAAIAAAPDHPIPRFNAAAALFQLQRYPDALMRYQESRARSTAALRTKIDYAMGNTALAMGDITAAIAHYDDCLASRVTGSDLDQVRRDAAINRRFAIEQAPPSIASESPPDEDSRNSPRGGPPRTRQPGNPGNDATDDPGANPPPQGGQPKDPAEERPTGRRRSGGRGGDARRPPSGETPDDRLDQALDRIRDAMRRRLPEELPPSSSADPRKDW